MKTTAKNLSYILALAVLILMVTKQAVSGEEFKKYVDKKFDVDNNATLMIKNKFGDVHCQDWNEASVSIKVEITVNASNQDKANKIFDKITVTLSGDRSKVSGTTEVGNMSLNNAEFSIDYYIMIPRSLNVELNNSFGEMYLDELDGTCKINLEYGEFDIKALNNTSNSITLRFSEGSVDYIKSGKVDVEYGKFRSDGANNLNIRSRFSEVRIDRLESLDLDSQYDDINIDKSGKADIVSRFSDVSIDELSGDFDLDCQYGEVEIDNIYAGFTYGKIDGAFTDFNLSFDPKASFNVDAEMKFCELSYPSNSSVSHREENYTTNIYSGVIGSNKSTTAKLTIDSQNGDVDISF